MSPLQVQLQFAASVLFMDGFAGLSDAASLATILAGIAPRSLLLLGANAEDTTHLAQMCASKFSKQQTKVIQPGKAVAAAGHAVKTFFLLLPLFSPGLLGAMGWFLCCPAVTL